MAQATNVLVEQEKVSESTFTFTQMWTSAPSVLAPRVEPVSTGRMVLSVCALLSGRERPAG